MLRVFLVLIVIGAFAVFGLLQYKPTLLRSALGTPPGDNTSSLEDPDDGLFLSPPPMPQRSSVSQNLFINVPVHPRSLLSAKLDSVNAQAAFMQGMQHFDRDKMNQGLVNSMQLNMFLSEVEARHPFLFFNQAIPKSLFQEETYITPEKYDLARTAYQQLTSQTPSILSRIESCDNQMWLRLEALSSLNEVMFDAVMNKKVSQRGHDLFSILTNRQHLQNSVRDVSILNTPERLQAAGRLLGTFRGKLVQQTLTTYDLTILHDMHRWCVFAEPELERIHSAIDELVTELSHSTDSKIVEGAARLPGRLPKSSDPKPSGNRQRAFAPAA